MAATHPDIERATRHGRGTPRVNSGRMLFQRAGSLNAQRQKGSERSPARKGIWAFPWPYFDWYWAAHQYQAVMPLRFRDADSSFGPRLARMTRRAPGPERFSDMTREEAERYWADRQRWVTKNGPKVLPVREFWHPGPVFTHLDARGGYLGYSEWRLVSVDELHVALRRHVASALPGRWLLHCDEPDSQPFECRSDDSPLEVFLPAGARWQTPRNR